MKSIPLFEFEPIEEKEFLSPEFKLNFSSNSNGKIIYASSDETVATVDGSGVVTITGAGNCLISIYQEETDIFESIIVSKFLFVKKSNQNITINPEVSSKSIYDEPFELEIFASSGAPIIVTNTDSNIIILETINNNKYKVTINSVGSSSLIITQVGNHAFSPITKELKIQIVENNLPTHINLTINSYNDIFKHDALNEIGILTSNNGSFNLSNNLKISSNQTVKGNIRDIGMLCLDAQNFILNISGWNSGILCCPPKTIYSSSSSSNVSSSSSSSSSFDNSNLPFIVKHLDSNMDDITYRTYNFEFEITGYFPITDQDENLSPYTKLEYILPGFYNWDQYPSDFYNWPKVLPIDDFRDPYVVRSLLFTGQILVNDILSYSNNARGYIDIDFRLRSYNENGNISLTSDPFRLSICAGGAYINNRWLCPTVDNCAISFDLISGTCPPFSGCEDIDINNCNNGDGVFDPKTLYTARDVPPCPPPINSGPCLTSLGLRTKVMPSPCPGRPIDIDVDCNCVQ